MPAKPNISNSHRKHHSPSFNLSIIIFPILSFFNLIILFGRTQGRAPIILFPHTVSVPENCQPSFSSAKTPPILCDNKTSIVGECNSPLHTCSLTLFLSLLSRSVSRSHLLTTPHTAPSPYHKTSSPLSPLVLTHSSTRPHSTHLPLPATQYHRSSN